MLLVNRFSLDRKKNMFKVVLNKDELEALIRISSIENSYCDGSREYDNVVFHVNSSLSVFSTNGNFAESLQWTYKHNKEEHGPETIVVIPKKELLEYLKNNTPSYLLVSDKKVTFDNKDFNNSNENVSYAKIFLELFAKEDYWLDCSVKPGNGLTTKVNEVNGVIQDSNDGYSVYSSNLFGLIDNVDDPQAFIARTNTKSSRVHFSGMKGKALWAALMVTI